MTIRLVPPPLTLGPAEPKPTGLDVIHLGTGHGARPSHCGRFVAPSGLEIEDIAPNERDRICKQCVAAIARKERRRARQEPKR